MKIYTLSKSRFLIILFCSAVLILGSLYYLFVHSFTGILKSTISLEEWFFSGFALIVVLCGVYSIFEAIKGKFVIDTNRVYLESAFGIRELSLSEIKGYRIHKAFIFIEPVLKNKKTLRISRYFFDDNDIVGWLSFNYSDLSRLEKKKQRKLFLTDSSFGSTKKERLSYLKRAKKVTNILDIIGYAIAAVVLLFSEISQISYALAIAAPVVFILILKWYKIVIKLDEHKSSPYPFVLAVIYPPIGVLFIRTLSTYDILDYGRVWIPSILIALPFFYLLVSGKLVWKLPKMENFLIMIFMALTAFVYGFSVVVSVNCEYDDSNPNQYYARVLKKRITGSKSKVYNLTLSSWGPMNSNKEVTVSRKLYDRVSVNGPVNVYLYKGRLHAPWFFVMD